MQKATFAGGCFWCMVTPFDELPGIISVVSGYTGGSKVNPTNEEVNAGETGHLEAVQITFDPDLFPYEKLLELYWQQIDPTDEFGQFQDRGIQFSTAIFYHDDKQLVSAVESKRALELSGRFDRPIVTRILPAAAFYPAEDRHQGYHKKNPDSYKENREKSGRDRFIRENWS